MWAKLHSMNVNRRWGGSRCNCLLFFLLVFGFFIFVCVEEGTPFLSRWGTRCGGVGWPYQSHERRLHIWLSIYIIFLNISRSGSYGINHPLAHHLGILSSTAYHHHSSVSTTTEEELRPIASIQYTLLNALFVVTFPTWITEQGRCMSTSIEILQTLISVYLHLSRAQISSYTRPMDWDKQRYLETWPWGTNGFRWGIRGLSLSAVHTVAAQSGICICSCMDHGLRQNIYSHLIHICLVCEWRNFHIIQLSGVGWKKMQAEMQDAGG